MSEIMPALFVGHGSPMNIILDNSFTRSLADWGRSLPRPRAILVVSAHWMTEGTFVATTARPRTLHDFYGFPRELYKVEYPAPGAPEAAELAAEAMRGTTVGRDADWGLDHGAWSVLRHLFPAADVPVFQLSLDYSFHDPRPRPVSYHYELAGELAALRRRGVLVIGSGNIVHNLSLIDFFRDGFAAAPVGGGVRRGGQRAPPGRGRRRAGRFRGAESGRGACRADARPLSAHDLRGRA